MLVSARLAIVVLATGLAVVGAGAQDAPMLVPTSPLSAPVIIAHRGASGLRPEHTIASYELAIAQGADFIEPDLVPTKDDVLVARHENAIGETTDVADHAEFADRRATKTIDGQSVTDWFVEDFTLAELKTLRARERLPMLRPDNAAFDGRFDIPTFAEIIDLAKRSTVASGRTIGVYPETKHPTYFASIGHPTDRLLADQLRAAGWDDARAPVFVQSFEVENLKRLKALTGVRLIQLIGNEGAPADGAVASYREMLTPAGLRAIAAYAWGIGPEKGALWTCATPTLLVRDAHALGLRVHPWTYRAENYFLPPAYRSGEDRRAHGDLEGEIAAALRLGVDGVFTDFSAIGFAAREQTRGTR